ncbi:MAG: LPS export ABC transporter periplasmic protein LptC [Muribaculaceae bacterium]|nr:LPS export ABC transporter periplasmic protein LptC [Muribaculaceae bacterium]
MRSPVSAIILLATLVATPVVVGCREESRVGVTSNIDVETTPTMVTHDVETLISDSGITRYKIISPIWLVYEEASVPRWRFPEGLNLEKFDLNLKVESTVSCDSATYFKSSMLWRLDGNVRISTVLGEKFLTNQIFWDQRKHTIYSDSFIHIEKPDRTLEGYGFTANERMTAYKVNRVSGIFPAELQNKPQAPGPGNPGSAPYPGSYPPPQGASGSQPSTPQSQAPQNPAP